MGPNAALLVSNEHQIIGTVSRHASEPFERDISWHAYTTPRDISADGRWLLVEGLQHRWPPSFLGLAAPQGKALMATLILSTVGTLVGGPVGGAIGAIIGQQIDNRVLAPKGQEQGTAEGAACARQEMDTQKALAEQGIRELVVLQTESLSKQ